MKFTSIVAMIGAASAINFAEGDTTPVWGLRSISDHREEAQTQIAFGNGATDSANARPPLRSHVMFGDESSDDEQLGELIQLQTFGGDKCKGITHACGPPARFMDNGGDDLFMRSVIENYSTEQENDDEEPTGEFLMSEAQGRALAKEVLGTHKGITGAAFTAYMGQYWSKAWGHWDVNRTGKIPILYAPSLMRFLMSDQYVQL